MTNTKSQKTLSNATLEVLIENAEAKTNSYGQLAPMQLPSTVLQVTETQPSIKGANRFLVLGNLQLWKLA